MYLLPRNDPTQCLSKPNHNFKRFSDEEKQRFRIHLIIMMRHFSWCFFMKERKMIFFRGLFLFLWKNCFVFFFAQAKATKETKQIECREKKKYSPLHFRLFAWIWWPSHSLNQIQIMFSLNNFFFPWVTHKMSFFFLPRILNFYEFFFSTQHTNWLIRSHILGGRKRKIPLFIIIKKRLYFQLNSLRYLRLRF